jgi:hypothetical protein
MDNQTAKNVRFKACIACLSHGLCTRPTLEGGDLCGRDYGLPDLLYTKPVVCVTQKQIADAYLASVREEDAFIRAWRPALMAAAEKAGVGDAALRFLERVDLLQLDGELPRSLRNA